MIEEEPAVSGSVLPTRAPCHFFTQGRRCNFGERCRFQHIRDNTKKVNGRSTQHESAPAQAVGSEGNMDHRDPHNKPKSAPMASRRPCRYFLSGFCSMEDRCRFWHPDQFNQPEIRPAPRSYMQPTPRRPPAPCPSNLQEVKLGDLTEEVAKQLRDAEIRQMKKRFPKDRLIVQERSDGLLTYYRATVEATDPDWPFDLKEIDIMVSFPDTYPQEIFTLDIPLDQALPPVMAGYVQESSVKWLQAKHATNQLCGKVELLFRPFLRWLDRSMERLFTEGARELKKEVDLEKAGLQFIPYQKLQVTAGEKADGQQSHTAACEESNGGSQSESGVEEREKLVLQECPGGDEAEEEGAGKVGEEEDAGEAASRLVENVKIGDSRRGTEVKLLGLRLGENTATVVAQRVTVCLQCNRCKVTADLTLTGRTPCTAQCEKCSASISAGFRPCMLHLYSDVLGYLDLRNATPTDLVLQDCDFIVGCLSCSQDGPVENISYGQTRDFNCEHCHCKLSFLAESTKFQYIQPRANRTGTSSSGPNYKTIRDPAVQKGKPLPEKGTCKHYKQSNRWLRFPCCGRAYPCDVCHDLDQDHPMELATRMICGYCAKEQPYSNGKPCVSCGGMMTRGARTSHWEGGLGCRNKVKMSRNDRHKYINTNKTVSRKAATEKK